MAKSLTKNELKLMVKEELASVAKSAKKNEAKIANKLEKLRVKLVPEMGVLESTAEVPGSRRLEKRIALKTVSELIDCPVNELLLFLLNNVKSKNERSLVEYHLGSCCFYAEGGLPIV